VHYCHDTRAKRLSNIVSNLIRSTCGSVTTAIFFAKKIGFAKKTKEFGFAKENF